MADHPVESLGGLTPLEHTPTPAFDRVAAEGRCGVLSTIPPGFEPGSEVANTAILGYDLPSVYEGRGPLEAASIGYEMAPDDLAMRCNILTLSEGRIVNHHGGHLTTAEGAQLIEYLNEQLADERVRFYPGTQYRHLLVIKGGSKYIRCTPPHDHPGELWGDCLVSAMPDAPAEEGRMTAEETAKLINHLILRSQALLKEHPFNQGRHIAANSIWPWSPGYRPSMTPLTEIYPEIKSGAVITAVDLIRGIGHYAGLRRIDVDGATGLPDTNYRGKAQAAIDALRRDDFVFLHIEACDEAGHDGDLSLKVHAIQSLDSEVIAPIINELRTWDQPVSVAIMPDHATPVGERVHRGEPVPFVIWHKGIEPDSVQTYGENACKGGAYGHLHLDQFMKEFMKL